MAPQTNAQLAELVEALQASLIEERAKSARLEHTRTDRAGLHVGGRARDDAQREVTGAALQLSARVAGTVEGLIDAESVGPVTLKGLARPVPVRSLRGLRAPGPPPGSR